MNHCPNCGEKLISKLSYTYNSRIIKGVHSYDRAEARYCPRCNHWFPELRGNWSVMVLPEDKLGWLRETKERIQADAFKKIP